VDEDLRDLERRARSTGSYEDRAALAAAKKRARRYTFYEPVEVDGITYVNAEPQLVDALASIMGDRNISAWVVYGAREDTIDDDGVFIPVGTPRERARGVIAAAMHTFHGGARVPLLTSWSHGGTAFPIILRDVLEIATTAKSGAKQFKSAPRGSYVPPRRTYYRHVEYRPELWTWAAGSGRLLRQDTDDPVTFLNFLAQRGGLNVGDLQGILSTERRLRYGTPGPKMFGTAREILTSVYDTVGRDRLVAADLLLRFSDWKSAVMSTISAEMLRDHRWVHSFCLNEASKSIESPWRGIAVEAMRPTWPSSVVCGICYSRTMEPVLGRYWEERRYEDRRSGGSQDV
jgi:hypothetical protein